VDIGTVTDAARADCHEVDPPEAKSRHREPRSGAAIQYKVLDCFVGCRLLALTTLIIIHRLHYCHQGEPQSGVAIQCKVQWIASSATASSNDDAYNYPPTTLLPSSRAAERRGDPVQGSVACFVGYRLLAMTTLIIIHRLHYCHQGEPQSGVAIQYKVLDCFVGYRLLAMTTLIIIHRLHYCHQGEPRSGVAIQCKVQWIASSATASSQ
jgi:hypothetical protein